MRRFVVFWTTSTMKDEKSAAKFHYIKTLSSSVVAQSIALRVVSIYCEGDDHFLLKSWLQVTYPLLKAASFDMFCLVAPQPQERKRSSITLNNSSTRAFQRAITKVLRRPYNFLKMGIKYLNLSSFGQFRQ